MKAEDLKDEDLLPAGEVCGWYQYETCPLTEWGYSSCNEKNFKDWRPWAPTKEEALFNLKEHCMRSGFHRDWWKENTEIGEGLLDTLEPTYFTEEPHSEGGGRRGGRKRKGGSSNAAASGDAPEVRDTLSP